jgi:hypothetical protein
MNWKSFFSGFASAFDLRGADWSDLPDPDAGFQQDMAALAGDWQRVGDDLRRAMSMVGSNGQ